MKIQEYITGFFTALVPLIYQCLHDRWQEVYKDSPYLSNILKKVFDLKEKGIARPITGWDMSRAEIRYYKKHRA